MTRNNRDRYQRLHGKLSTVVYKNMGMSLNTMLIGGLFQPPVTYFDVWAQCKQTSKKMERKNIQLWLQKNVTQMKNATLLQEREEMCVCV
jgi:hypothetical protein